MNLIVQTRDEWLHALAKPKLEAVTELALAPNDWLVLCAGFEERALGALKAAITGSARFNVLLVNYLPLVEENRADEIRQICGNANVAVIDVTYDRQEPAGFGQILLDKLTARNARVVIDVSAMSRLLIVQVLVALGLQPDGFGECSIVYAEAAEYPPSEAEARAELAKSNLDPTFLVLFLSSGTYDVTVVPELSSMAPAGAQTRLIAFPSLDSHNLTALRAEIQPSRFTFIEGVPPSDKNKWRQSVIAELNHLDQILEAERVTASTLDYQENLNLLLTLYSKYAERERLVISPTGSKMQAVAVGILRAFVRDVQIVYPTPDKYRTPRAHTLGIGPIRHLSLAPFSHEPWTSIVGARNESD